MRASCLASWQSPSSSIQGFHWDRLYSGVSAGIGATMIARVVAGLAAGGSASVVRSWVGIGVDVSIEEAGDGVASAVVVSGVPWGGGVGMMFVGDGAMEPSSAVAATDVGVAAGAGVWPEQGRQNHEGR